MSVLLTVPAAVYLYRRDNRLRPVSVLGVGGGCAAAEESVFLSR